MRQWIRCARRPTKQLAQLVPQQLDGQDAGPAEPLALLYINQALRRQARVPVRCGVDMSDEGIPTGPGWS
jgi:hypothetical protein